MLLFNLSFLIFFLRKCDGVDLFSAGNYIQNLIEARAAIPELEKDVIINEVVFTKFLLQNFPASAGYAIEDNYLNITQLVRKYGYDLETHYVTTQDGYILTLHRIPNKGPVVFLNHGILLSSDDFVIAGPKSATAYYFASRGYDVWMANARGNKHSKRHIYLDPQDQPAFFNFTFHEIGVYDTSTNIDYILKTTGRKKLNYVGFSQGNTAFFVLCSLFPEYNEKINVMVALAPIAWFSRLFSPVLRLAVKFNLFKILMSLGQYEFLPDPILFGPCNSNNLVKFLCLNGVYLTFGFDRGSLNYTNIPVITNHAFSGSSAKQFDHYGQVIESGRFRQYDFGTAGNYERYGQDVPPDYPVHKVTAPVALFYSQSDWWSSKADVDELKKNLPNVVDYHEASYYSHIDYVYGRDIDRNANRRILRLIKQFSDNEFNDYNSFDYK